jgi:uncharacterized lipoprotein YddW (UPF0748 family)
MGKSRLLVALAAQMACLASAQVEYPGLTDSLVVPAIPREFRAAWVATVWNIDWPSARTLSVASQKAEIDSILTTAKAMNLNALCVQVRSMCDAMYQSSIEPWSYFLTNSMGAAPNPFYDPLQYWIDKGKEKGIAIYAWFNPYRAKNSGVAANSTHISVTRPDLVKTYGSDLYLDPGEPDALTRTKNVIFDVVARYDLDGVVYDDYFYPYPITNTPFPDTTSFATYGGGLSLSNWRRQNIDNMVQQVNTGIKLVKPNVKFGIGPFGIWKPGFPAGVTGLSSYDSLYADTRKWMQLGWVDFMAPQLYWQIDSSGQPYGALLSWWVAQNLSGRHVYASNFTSKIADGTSTPWTAQEILNQVDLTRATPGATGNIHYSFKVFKQDRGGIKTSLQNGQYAVPALPPTAAWIDNIPPVTPNVQYFINRSAGTQTFLFSPADIETPFFYAVAYLETAGWRLEFRRPAQASYSRAIKTGGPLRAIAVAAVDRLGNASPWRKMVFDSSAVTTDISRDWAQSSPSGSQGVVQVATP